MKQSTLLIPDHSKRMPLIRARMQTKVSSHCRYMFPVLANLLDLSVDVIVHPHQTPLLQISALSGMQQDQAHVDPHSSRHSRLLTLSTGRQTDTHQIQLQCPRHTRLHATQ
jgi:hypothetical protein